MVNILIELISCMQTTGNLISKNPGCNRTSTRDWPQIIPSKVGNNPVFIRIRMIDFLLT